ncbi:hypothetical protein CsSME_00045589 [Camellia sinensis var. sinensis]
MEVLALVQGFVAKRATAGQMEMVVALANVNAKLNHAKFELEAACHEVVMLEFNSATEQKRTGEIQGAYTTTNEKLEKAFVNNEELRDQTVKEKEDADA